MKTARSSAGGPRKRSSATPAEGHQQPDEDAASIERAADGPRYQTFTVRFLLDERGCRRTEVTHVQLGVSETWAGYDAARLASWIAERVQPEPLEAPAPAPAPAAAPAPVPALRDLALLVDGRPAQSIEAGSPVTARLTLDLAGPAGEIQDVEYYASVSTRRIGGQHQILGEMSGLAKIGGAALIEVQGVAPPPGIYRLSANVVIRRPDGRSEGVSGGLIQIYE